MFCWTAGFRSTCDSWLKVICWNAGNCTRHSSLVNTSEELLSRLWFASIRISLMPLNLIHNNRIRVESRGYLIQTNEPSTLEFAKTALLRLFVGHGRNAAEPLQCFHLSLRLLTTRFHSRKTAHIYASFTSVIRILRQHNMFRWNISPKRIRNFVPHKKIYPKWQIAFLECFPQSSYPETLFFLSKHHEVGVGLWPSC